MAHETLSRVFDISSVAEIGGPPYFGQKRTDRREKSQ